MQQNLPLKDSVLKKITSSQKEAPVSEFVIKQEEEHKESCQSAMEKYKENNPEKLQLIYSEGSGNLRKANEAKDEEK